MRRMMEMTVELNLQRRIDRIVARLRDRQLRLARMGRVMESARYAARVRELRDRVEQLACAA